jgi:uncharacterized protein (DUF362 family)
MDRRRFLNVGLVGAGFSAMGSPIAVRASRDPGAGGAGSAALDVMARFSPEPFAGRVASAGDLLPAGTHPRSNRDPLPAERMRSRLDAGMVALLGPGAWERLFSPSDVVAIKINGLASGHLSPRTELIWALVDALRSVGIPDGKIIIWERTTRELERSGFPLQTQADAVRAYGTDALRGGGYGREFESFGSVGSLVSRIVGEYATALINVGVLKDHDLAGVSAGMKNLYGIIHNPNRYHDHACDPYVAEVTALASVRRTLRLTIIDAILAQAEGGPAYRPDWIWPCNRLLVALDPVACDRVAWDLIEEERARRGQPSLAEAQREPRWIASAARLGLGRAADPDLQEV